MTFKHVLKGLVLASVMTAASSQASIAHLQLEGTAGDYITRGQSVDNVYSSADPLLRSNYAYMRNIGTAEAPAAASMWFSLALSSPDTIFTKTSSLSFASESWNGPLRVGTTYLNAERFGGYGYGGLDVSYDHRGCNRVRGSFTINQLRYKAGAIDRFDVAFTQICDNGSAMTGSFFYDATLTALPTNDVPEPASLALLGLGLAGAGLARRRKQA